MGIMMPPVMPLSAGGNKGMLAWIAMLAAAAGVSLGVAAATYYSRLAAAVAAAIGRCDASMVRTFETMRCTDSVNLLQIHGLFRWKEAAAASPSVMQDLMSCTCSLVSCSTFDSCTAEARSAVWNTG